MEVLVHTLACFYVILCAHTFALCASPLLLALLPIDFEFALSLIEVDRFSR